ncbi:hypothetical protein EST38_g7778 [Candolleomyces aberdarensis]|uniref:Major facilitator superfamily (MFS) profile domain-containing protein n=1 Tax=Candolleomyces aberdarensis TaxID=2316362 RepID=A0A4Q2DG23_9AGAR|nr:hypothetical protein EST38_g7778 [Candolleomyces aberdarensis]
MPIKEQIVVTWEENDPENPQNWSRLKRWYITIMSSILILNATFASSAPVGVTGSLKNEFNLSHEVGVLPISLFVAGFCVGPLIWGPLSEQYGRRPIFILSFFAYTLFQVGDALSRNTASLLIFRLLGGTFAACPLSNSGAVIGDIWDANTRGKALAFFTLAPFAGPAIGPTISGYLQVSGVSWRWIFWLLAIFAGVCFLLILFTLPETYGPVLLVKKAKRLRNETGDLRYVAPLELTNISFAQRLKNILLKPFVVLIREPMLIAVTAYMSFIYGNIYLLLQAYPVVFTQGHHLNTGVSGLMLLNLPVGGVIAVFIYILWINPRYERAIQKHAPHPVPPEIRLEMTLIGAPLFVIAFFWFGVCLGVSVFFIFLSLINYIVDAYLFVAASALAANTFVRSIAGAVFPLFATQMYEALNPRWASTLLGLIALVMMPIPFVLIKFGPRLRKNSKYAPSKPKEAPTLSEAPTLTSPSADNVPQK